jgi:hypothetical protein
MTEPEGHKTDTRWQRVTATCLTCGSPFEHFVTDRRRYCLECEDRHRKDLDRRFGSRIANALHRADVRSFDELRRLSDSELLAYNNFGQTSLRQIRAVVPSPSDRVEVLHELAGSRRGAGVIVVSKRRHTPTPACPNRLPTSVRAFTPEEVTP